MIPGMVHKSTEFETDASETSVSKSEDDPTPKIPQ